MMAAPATKNPFYVMLLLACAALLITMFIYLSGWMYVPDPDRPQRVFEKPPIVTWVDRNILYLMPIEIGLVILLAVLTIMLDSWFDPPVKRQVDALKEGSPPPTQS